MIKIIEEIRKPGDSDEKFEAYGQLMDICKQKAAEFVDRKDASEELGFFIAGIVTSDIMKDVKSNILFNKITPEECLEAYLVLAFKNYAKGEKRNDG